MKKVIATILVLFATACSDTHPNSFAFDAGPDGSTDTDTDGDSDTDTDVDAGPDGSTDTDTDTDTDSDSDAGLDGSADTDTDTDSDTDSDTDTETEVDTDADAGPDAGEDAGPYDPYDCAGGHYDPWHDNCWQDPLPEWPVPLGWTPLDGCGYTWQQAVNYCENLDLGGHTNWVLPSKWDYVGIIDNCEDAVFDDDPGFCDSCIESTSCSELFGTTNEEHWFWTASPNMLDPENSAWTASFSNNDGGYSAVWGSSKWTISEPLGYDMYLCNNIRCVRPGA